MPNVTRTYTPSFIIQGSADIYVDVQAPPSAIPPVEGTNTWALTGTYSLDSKGQPTDNGSSGFHIGLSDGPTVVSFTPKFLEIRADQHAAPVDAAFTSLETEVDIIAEEALLQNLSKFFSSTIGTYTNVTAGANPACDFLQIGSTNTDAVTSHSLLIVSPDRAAVGHFYVVQLYKCFLKSAIEFTFKRDTATKWKLKFFGCADTTRSYGDQVCQVCKLV